MLYYTILYYTILYYSSMGKWGVWAKTSKWKNQNLLILERLKSHFIETQITK